MVQRHNIVIPVDAGGIEIYPLKQWLRDNRNHVPSGMDPTTSTSHELRRGLQKLGWVMQETPEEIRLIKPGAAPEVIENILGAPENENIDIEEPTFTLEYQLRDFLAANLSTIPLGDGKKVRVFVDSTGRDGVEYPTAVGPVDILAIDSEGDFFVFELKRANSSDKAIGQLARYMGWVTQTIGKNKKVYGVIVARTISENLRYAAAIVPNVYLYEYAVEFKLRTAHELTRRAD